MQMQRIAAKKLSTIDATRYLVNRSKIQGSGFLVHRHEKLGRLLIKRRDSAHIRMSQESTGD